MSHEVAARYQAGQADSPWTACSKSLDEFGEVMVRGKPRGILTEPVKRQKASSLGWLGEVLQPMMSRLVQVGESQH